MEVIYSHSTFSDCTADLPLCAGGRGLYRAGVHDPTKTRTRPTWHYRRWRLSPLSRSFILRTTALKGYLTSCPRMLLEEVTARRLLFRDFIVARLYRGSFAHFQNDYIVFPTEWEEIKRKIKLVDGLTARSKISVKKKATMYFFFPDIACQHLFMIVYNNLYVNNLSFFSVVFLYFYGTIYIKFSFLIGSRGPLLHRSSRVRLTHGACLESHI